MTITVNTPMVKLMAMALLLLHHPGKSEADFSYELSAMSHLI